METQLWTQISLLQDPRQFYDTPRNLKESLQGDHPQHPPAFGNYDFPQNGSLPVYRKQCGCVIKLVSAAAQNSYSWQCVSDGESPASSLRMSAPRARLTGTGKMPVVDMSAPPAAGPSSLPVTGSQGLPPPKSPVYAAVNKCKKTPKPHHNYCNIEPNMRGGPGNGNGGHVYENTKSVLDRLHLEQQRRAVDLPPNYQNLDFSRGRNRQEQARDGNYLMMNPVGSKGERTSYSYTNLTELPLIPFQPNDGLPPDPNIYCDSINRKLRQFHDSLNPEESNGDDEEDFPPPPEPGQLLDLRTPTDVEVKMPPQTEKSHSMENMVDPDSEVRCDIRGHLEDNTASEATKMAPASMTMPRSSSTMTTSGAAGRAVAANDGTLSLPAVSMRRSSSVPCKRLNSRGSTGSSDSGFSAGSPGGAGGGHKSRSANGERDEDEATNV